MPATITPFPTRTPDPATQTALAELLQLGLAVARLAARLAEVETEVLDAVAEAAPGTARAARAAHPSLAHALGAGRDADRNDAERNALVARVAAITATFDKAARAVRRTATLQARLAEGRPFLPRPSDPGRTPAAARTERPGNDPARGAASDADRADRPDTPEWGEEFGTDTPAEVLHDIRRDLAGAIASLPSSALPSSAAPAVLRPAPAAPPAPASPAPLPAPARPGPPPPPPPDS